MAYVPPIIFQPEGHRSPADYERVGSLVVSVMPRSADTPWRADVRNLMKDLVARDRLEDAHLVMGFIQRANPRCVDVVGVNLIMSAYKRRSQHYMVLAVFQQMREARVVPDGVSFNIAIDACGKSKDLAGAFAYLMEMRTAGWPPTVSTYTSLIDACGKNNELDHAESLLQQMLTEGVPPNACTYTALIQACCKVHEHQRGLRVLEHITYMYSVTPPHLVDFCPTPFTTLIRSCIDAGDITRSFAALRMMTSMRLTPDPITLIQLIDACNTLHLGDFALDVFRLFRTCQMNPCGRRSSTDQLRFNTTLSLLGDATELAKVSELLFLSSSCSWNLAPSATVSAQILALAADDEKIDLAFSVLPSIFAIAGKSRLPTGVGASLAKLFTLCVSAGLEGRARTALFYYTQPALTGGISTPKATYASVLGAMRESDAFAMLLESDAAPADHASVDAMLETCIEARAFICAHDLLEYLRGTDIAPDPQLATRLLKECNMLIDTHESLHAALLRIGVSLADDISPVSVMVPARTWPTDAPLDAAPLESAPLESGAPQDPAPLEHGEEQPSTPIATKKGDASDDVTLALQRLSTESATDNQSDSTSPSTSFDYTSAEGQNADSHADGSVNGSVNGSINGSIKEGEHEEAGEEAGEEEWASRDPSSTSVTNAAGAQLLGLLQHGFTVSQASYPWSEA